MLRTPKYPSEPSQRLNVECVDVVSLDGLSLWLAQLSDLPQTEGSSLVRQQPDLITVGSLTAHLPHTAGTRPPPPHTHTHTHTHTPLTLLISAADTNTHTHLHTQMHTLHMGLPHTCPSKTRFKIPHHLFIRYRVCLCVRVIFPSKSNRWMFVPWSKWLNDFMC